MFEIDIQREFAAAHCLKGYNGNCSAMHGHNWIVQAFVQTVELDTIGIAVDFRRLKNELDKILARLDHACLNNIEPFIERNPTSENLAQYIFEELAKVINAGTVKVSKIRVCESPGSGATYLPDDVNNNAKM